MRNAVSLVLFLVTSVLAAGDVGSFQGRVAAVWLTDENSQDRQMELLEDFAFTGPDGKLWAAPKGSVVDGASIPRVFWRLIGPPFAGDYRRASVVHDVACQEKKERWEDVHRMFYFACRAGGVAPRKAKIMYLAVYAGGPRWGAGVPKGSPTHWNEERLQQAMDVVMEKDLPFEEVEALARRTLR